MKVKSVSSRWIYEEGLRLDCGPYLCGAFESRKIIEGLNVQKQKLKELTTGHDGGIYNGPQFSRNFVNSFEHGVPFLTSSTFLRADLNNIPLLRKKDALSSKLRHLELSAGTTLISCSGTVGRMSYTRPDMKGMWASQDVMKVVPDQEKILPGYLYAYLSSKFGVPIIISGTYGAVIQHIEPKHIADLPVPRLGNSVENKSHELVQKAAENIAEHSQLMNTASQILLSKFNLQELSREDWYDDEYHLGWSEKSIHSESLRALNYDPRIAFLLNQIRRFPTSELGTLCHSKWFKGKIFFKRIDSHPNHGCLLVGQRTAFQLRPDGRWISQESIKDLGLQVPEGSTLIPSHGTLGEYELYCRALYVTKRTSEYAFSGDFFRCIPKPDLIQPGYLFAFLRSSVAFRILRSISAGGKQQEQHPAMMYRLPIPRLNSTEEKEIAALVEKAAKLFDQGLNLEDQARMLVEEAIEEAA